MLMSHDPTHYELEVMNDKAPVELTLSGHTHGMQMGIEIPWLGIKWSPSSLTYKRWGGLYLEKDQYLHVNRGFGVLGFPGRIGMPPEITILTLAQGSPEAQLHTSESLALFTELTSLCQTIKKSFLAW